MKINILTTTVSALAILAFGAAAQAETVTTTTETRITEQPVIMVPVEVPATTQQSVTTTTKSYVQQKAIPGAPLRVNFDAFDRNQNGILSMAEVGEHLFYLFDTDGNEVIDNIEFTNKRVVTIAPMEKHTLKMVDFESDGSAELSTYTYETFTTTSGLTRFDNDLDGLSASEFIDTSFLKLDKDNSKAVELDEWKAAYIASRAPQAADQDGYNN